MTSSECRETSEAYCCTGADGVGLLTCLDGYMNVALEQTEEYSGGRLTGRFGECFLRGNNGKSQSHRPIVPSPYSQLYLWDSVSES